MHHKITCQERSNATLTLHAMRCNTRVDTLYYIRINNNGTWQHESTYKLFVVLVSLRNFPNLICHVVDPVFGELKIHCHLCSVSASDFTQLFEILKSTRLLHAETIQKTAEHAEKSEAFVFALSYISSRCYISVEIFTSSGNRCFKRKVGRWSMFNQRSFASKSVWLRFSRQMQLAAHESDQTVTGVKKKRS